MSSSAPDDLTELLKRARDGDSTAESEAYFKVFEALRELARHAFRNERSDHTLQPTALVNEAWMKLRGPDNHLPEVNSRGQFFAMAGNAMRQILVDHARSKQRKKRGGGRTMVSLEDTDFPTESPAADVLVVDDLLDRLAADYPRPAQVVKLKFFAGCTNPQTAEALGVHEATVRDDWRFAKAWLERELKDEDE